MNLDPKTLDRLIPLDSASHAEVTGLCINIPTRYAECFATTADAYRAFLANDGLDKRIHGVLETLDVDDMDALSRAGSKPSRLASRKRVVLRIRRYASAVRLRISSDTDISAR